MGHTPKASKRPSRVAFLGGRRKGSSVSISFVANLDAGHRYIFRTYVQTHAITDAVGIVSAHVANDVGSQGIERRGVVDIDLTQPRPVRRPHAYPNAHSDSHSHGRGRRRTRVSLSPVGSLLLSRRRCLLRGALVFPPVVG